jgi:chromosome segregation ATPase
MLRGGARKAQTEGVGLEDATRWKAEARRLEEELRKAKEARGPVGSVLVPPSTDDFLDAIRAQSAEIERLKETIRQSPSKNPAAEPKQVKQLLNTSRKQQAEIAKLKQELKAVDESKRALEQKANAESKRAEKLLDALRSGEADTEELKEQLNAMAEQARIAQDDAAHLRLRLDAALFWEGEVSELQHKVALANEYCEWLLAEVGRLTAILGSGLWGRRGSFRGASGGGPN